MLKSAVVYGANASGKTKLIEALAFLRYFIHDSFKETQVDEPIRVDSFRLSSETEEEPSLFEIIFVYDEQMYRYGFEVDRKKVHSEWLYQNSTSKEQELFYRDFQDFTINEKKLKVADLIANDRIRPNALLLSVAANWNDKTAKKILDWFNTFHIISGLRQEGYEGYSMERIRDDKNNKEAVISLLKNADLGIEDLDIQTLDLENLPTDFPKELKKLLAKNVQEENDAEIFSGVSTYHKKFDVNLNVKELVEFSMDNDESSGTKKYFAISGPILETLKNGDILMVDELANKLHPNLTEKLLEIFNSKEKNPKNAQLIFNTHDTNFLNSGIFRRDQIWFTEKDRYGASKIFSLSDFKTDVVRKEDNFEKNYIKGKYGAVPYLGDFD